MRVLVMQACEYKEHLDNYDGVCTMCAAIREGDTEPDAECYPCEECGQNAVLGIENALIEGIIDIAPGGEVN